MEGDERGGEKGGEDQEIWRSHILLDMSMRLQVDKRLFFGMEAANMQANSLAA